VEFRSTDRDFVIWDLGGISADATGVFDLENEDVWHPLEINPTTKTATALFCGNDYATPGFAVVVSTTSHIRLRIMDGSVQRDLDGGFIRMVV
jgi:hypothetical protein